MAARITPGGYVRQCREAARLSIAEAAELIADRPGYVARFAAHLTAIEADSAVATGTWLFLIGRAFPIDRARYRDLVAGMPPPPGWIRGTAARPHRSAA